MKIQRYVRRMAVVNSHDVFTGVPRRDIVDKFRVVEPGGKAYVFDANAFATSVVLQLNFRNPYTNREINRVELSRLVKLFSPSIGILVSATADQLDVLSDYMRSTASIADFHENACARAFGALVDASERGIFDAEVLETYEDAVGNFYKTDPRAAYALWKLHLQRVDRMLKSATGEGIYYADILSQHIAEIELECSPTREPGVPVLLKWLMSDSA